MSNCNEVLIIGLCLFPFFNQNLQSQNLCIQTPKFYPPASPHSRRTKHSDSSQSASSHRQLFRKAYQKKKPNQKGPSFLEYVRSPIYLLVASYSRFSYIFYSRKKESESS
jgi:hypothetical protein